MKMIKNIYDVLLAVVMLSLTLIVASCSDSDTDVLPDVNVNNRQVGITLTVSDVPQDETTSRATPADGDYDKGSGYENYIDLANEDFKFYIFSMADKCVGEITINSLTPIEQNPLQQSKTYVALGQINSSIAGNQAFKVVVLANWRGNYPQLKVGDDMAILWQGTDNTTIYEYMIAGLSTEHTVPLYGVKCVSAGTLREDEFASLGRIHLLRAYAKVEVNVDDSVDALESVTISRVNSRGYKAPKGVRNESDYVHGSYESDYTNTPNIPAGCEVLADVPMHKVSGGDTGQRKYIAYVPEYDNTTSSAKKSIIQLNYADNRINSKVIEFKYYKATGTHTENEAFDLLRNYWYKFNASQQSVEVDLKVVVDVQPYAKVELKPTFGLERDENGNIVIRDSDGHIIKLIIIGSDVVLSYDRVVVPQYGQATGVFDEKGTVLMYDMDDGRQIIYTYADDAHTNFLRWEMYSSGKDANGRDVPKYIEEEYEQRRYDWATGQFHDIYCHNYYDSRSLLVGRYRYKDRESYEKRENYSIVVETSWEYGRKDDKGNLISNHINLGEEYQNYIGRPGEKDISYYENTKFNEERADCFMVVTVRWVKVPKKDPVTGDDIPGEYDEELQEDYIYLRDD